MGGMGGGMGAGMGPGAGGTGGGGLLSGMGGGAGGGLAGLQSKFNDWKTSNPDQWSGIQSKIADLRSQLPQTREGWQQAMTDWKSKIPQPGAPTGPQATPQAASATPQAGLLSATPQAAGGDWQSGLPHLADGRLAPWAHMPPSMWSALEKTMGTVVGNDWKGYPTGPAGLQAELSHPVTGESGGKWDYLQGTYPGWNLTDTTKAAGPDWIGPNGEPPTGAPPQQQAGGGDYMSQLPRLADGRVAPWAHLPPSMWAGLNDTLGNVIGADWKGYPAGKLEAELANPVTGAPGGKWSWLENSFIQGLPTDVKPNYTDTTRPPGPDWVPQRR